MTVMATSEQDRSEEREALREALVEAQTALLDGVTQLSDLTSRFKAGQRRWRSRERGLRRAAAASAAAALASGTMVVMVDNSVLRVLWLIAVLETAWICGFTVAHRRAVNSMFDIDGEPAERVEQEGLLARIDKRVGAYPNLWLLVPSLIALVVTLLT